MRKAAYIRVLYFYHVNVRKTHVHVHVHVHMARACDVSGNQSLEIRQRTSNSFLVTSIGKFVIVEVGFNENIMRFFNTVNVVHVNPTNKKTCHTRH